MLRNLTTFFIAAMSAALWKDYRHNFDIPHLIGLIILICGACIITYASVGFNQTGDAEAKNPLLGALLVLVGCIFSSLMYVMEELFLRKIFIKTGLISVGIEGGWGMILISILLPIFSAIDDPFTNIIPKPKMENPKLWYQ